MNAGNSLGPCCRILGEHGRRGSKLPQAVLYLIGTQARLPIRPVKDSEGLFKPIKANRGILGSSLASVGSLPPPIA